jgi:hypothetical protein
MSAVNDVLGWVPLCESVQVIKGGIPRPLPDVFYDTTEEIQGNLGSYIDYTGTRMVARVQPAYAPPQPTNKLTLTSTNLKLLSAQESMPFNEELRNLFRQWEQYRPQDQWSLRNVTWQGGEFARRFENLRIAAVNMTTAQGTLWFDTNGNLLPSSSGATLTVSQGVQSTNFGTLNGLLTGSYADPNFDIVTFQTQKLKPRALEDTNYPTRTAIYGANIPGYFANNTYVKLAWGYQAEYAKPYLAGGVVPPGFNGFEWIAAAEEYWQDQNGNNQLIFPPDQITFMPTVDKGTWTMFVGSELIPTQFGPLPTGEAALKSFAEKFGRWRYAYIPQGTTFQIMDVAGDTFLPRLKVPNSTYFLDTTA